MISPEFWLHTINILMGVVIVFLLMQRNNALVLFAIILKRGLPLVVTVLGSLASLIFYLLLDSATNSDEKQEQLDKEYEPYKDPKSYMNYNGDYCDKNKSNWYY